MEQKARRVCTKSVTFCQDEKTCVVYGMPKVAVETGREFYQAVRISQMQF